MNKASTRSYAEPQCEYVDPGDDTRCPLPQCGEVGYGPHCVSHGQLWLSWGEGLLLSDEIEVLRAMIADHESELRKLRIIRAEQEATISRLTAMVTQRAEVAELAALLRERLTEGQSS